MACYANLRPCNPNNNSILDLLKRIDQMQKEAILSNLTGGCDVCLLRSLYNTKPVSIQTVNGVLNAYLDPTTGTITTLFRIEEVRGNETVLLRLIDLEGDQMVCTDRTIICRIECICCVQCFDAIECSPCNMI